MTHKTDFSEDPKLIELNLKRFPTALTVRENSKYQIYERDRIYRHGDEFHVVYKRHGER